jgi:hypothetical protein
MLADAVDATPSAIRYTSSMQRFKGKAALLLLVLMMPLPRVCAAITSRSEAHQQCCRPQHADACCPSSAKPCGAPRAPAETALYLDQSSSPLVLPVVTVAIVDLDPKANLKSRCVTPHRPAQHPPPGLVIAATIVLRI